MKKTPIFPCPFFIAFSSDVIAQVRKRVKLEGKELEDFLEKDKVKKEAAKKLEQAKEYVSANKQCFSYPKTAVYSHITHTVTIGLNAKVLAKYGEVPSPHLTPQKPQFK